MLTVFLESYFCVTTVQPPVDKNKCCSHGTCRASKHLSDVDGATSMDFVKEKRNGAQRQLTSKH